MGDCSGLLKVTRKKKGKKKQGLCKEHILTGEISRDILIFYY